MELSTSRKGKMEAKPEVSVLELYYTAKYGFRERQKGIVSRNVANDCGL